MINELAILISGGGTNMMAIINAIEAGEIPAKISIVIADRPAAGIKKAEKKGIKTLILDRAGKSKLEFDKEILNAVQYSGAKGIILAGYLSIIDKNLVEAYPNAIINVHPALIPSFCGLGFYGEKVHQGVIDYGCKVSGVTVHFVDENADTGAIIAQSTVEVHHSDTAHSLAEKIHKVEHAILPFAVKKLCEGKLNVNGRIVEIID